MFVCYLMSLCKVYSIKFHKAQNIAMMEESYNRLKVEAGRIGERINKLETKYIRATASKDNNINLSPLVFVR